MISFKLKAYPECNQTVLFPVSYLQELVLLTGRLVSPFLPDIASRWNVRYSHLPTKDVDDDFDGNYDPRFDYTLDSFDKIPWKSITLALFLLSLGSLLRFLRFFILTGYEGRKKSQAYNLLSLDVVTFPPSNLLKVSSLILLITFKKCLTGNLIWFLGRRDPYHFETW